MAYEFPEEFQRLIKDFERGGLAGKVGLGATPAIVAVDFSSSFTDPARPLGGDFSPQIEATKALVEAGAHADIPVVYSVPRFEANLRDASPWFAKIPELKSLASGTPGVELDPRLNEDETGVVMYKKYPSVFFGTDLATILISHGVDTVIVTGITTSGCVRATAVDSCSYGFRTIVVEEGVGDRAELPHVATLFDLEMKYADIMSQAEVVAYLQALPAPAARSGR